MGRVVHFEIPSDDPQRAADFYGQLFGWRFQDANVGVPYLLATTGEEGEPGIDGAIQGRQGATAQGVTNTIGVESLDDTLDHVRKLGGTVVTEPAEIPGVGRFAYCQDLDGHLFGVLQPVQPG